MPTYNKRNVCAGYGCTYDWVQRLRFVLLIHCSVQDDIVAFLFSKGVSVFARRDETVKQYKEGIKEVLNTRPEVLVDDG